MNAIFILCLLGFGVVGIFINKYWEDKLGKIIHKQTKIKTSSNAIDVLIGMFGSWNKIKKIDKIKGLGADYYSHVNDEFFLTVEAERYNTASVTIAYFLGLLKIATEKAGSRMTFLNILRLILNPLLIIFTIIAIISSNVIYVYIVICVYAALVILYSILNINYFLVTKSFAIKSFKIKKVSVPQDVFSCLSEFVSARWWQLVTMLIFQPMLVAYYYINFLIKNR